MRYSNIALALLLLSNIALSFQDIDIDGVDDTVDKCLDTPFDELVDENGCSKSEKPATNYGSLTVKIGTDIFTDKEYDSDSSLNLYANYRYKSWNISVSNSRLTTNSNYSEDNSYSDSDTYISVGKNFTLDKNIFKLSIGTKIAGDTDNNREHRGKKAMQREGSSDGQNSQNSQNYTQSLDDSRDNDYFASLNYNYLLNDKQNLFLYYGYTKSGDSETTEYENYSSFSLGSGYLFTQNWYGALSYSYTESIYKDGDVTNSINLFNSYNFTKNIFATAGYSYALEDLSYDNSFSLALGFTF